MKALSRMRFHSKNVTSKMFTKKENVSLNNMKFVQHGRLKMSTIFQILLVKIVMKMYVGELGVHQYMYI